MNIKIISLVGLVLIGGAFGWFLNEIEHPATADTSPLTATTSVVPASIDANDFVSMRPAITALPQETLSNKERDGLIFMREEEKLARDVYTVLFEKWGVQIFSNIAQSEQTHTEAVRTILTKYNIEDPVTDDSIGVFEDDSLATLYSSLTTQGSESLEDALTVGGIIEDLDIRDLQNQIALTDNADIKLVYENLLRGSRNHLRSFAAQLTARGSTYTPEYITQSEFETITNSPKETGSGNSNRGWGKN